MQRQRFDAVPIEGDTALMCLIGDTVIFFNDNARQAFFIAQLVFPALLRPKTTRRLASYG